MAGSIQREYGFLFCVGAELELARLCPGGDLARIKDMLSAKGADALEFGAELICILSRWYEKGKRLELGEGYEPAPLTKEEILLLPLPTFMALQTEALQAIKRDQQQTVEAEAKKKEAAQNRAE